MWSNISTSSSSPRATNELKGGGFEPSLNGGAGPADRDAGHPDAGPKNSMQADIKPRYGSPLMRYKHAVCAAQASGYIFIHGGRFGNLALDDDVWRFDPHQNSWIQLETSGEKPPSLQEHTLVEFNDRLYLFGGQISASSTENSFWCLNLASNEWRSLSMKSSKYGAYLGPTNRRGHTAVIYGNSMYIYGGFEDFRGSSGQLWEYDLLNERWELRNLSASSSCHPEPRHSHSAIVYNDSMYIYGGLSNLKPLGELWRWSWRERRWFRERTKGRAPGQLHGHTAIQAFGSMFVFGGERNGRTTRGLWRLNLSNMTWQKIRPKGPRPSPSTWHGAIANPLGILDEANYIIEGDPDLLKDVSISSDNCMSYEDMEQSHHHQAAAAAAAKQDDQSAAGPGQRQVAAGPGAPVLAHSKSSNADMVTAIRNGQDRSKQRRSRLSFLRRSRHERPKSIYELKQIRTSLSANNFKREEPAGSSSSNCSNNPKENARHSVAVLKSEPNQQCDQQSSSMECDDSKPSQQETNVGILDSLDTDIKEMFQQAMSPKLKSSTEEEEEEQQPMSVDGAMADVTSQSTRQSQYQTAMPAGSRTFSSMNLRSQRTSIAYTTPPSEMNTLRDDDGAGRGGGGSQATLDLVEHSRVQRQRALLATSSVMAGGGGGGAGPAYNKRDNRPRSEIVQSLIDRADARIKHLYTPYFNHQSSVGQPAGGDKLFQPHQRTDGAGQTQQQQQQRRRGQSFLDKSKRHTIHQTMTHYSLYFSEDKSSSSPASDSTNQESTSPKDSPNETAPTASAERPTNAMASDDLSSNSGGGGGCMRGTTMASTSGALIGVHGGTGSQAADHQHSQLSLLDANISSDSRTLCNDTATNQQQQQQYHFDGSLSTSNSAAAAAAAAAAATTTTTNSASFQNALTARRDTSAESCDNTSLSFSVIAEFEEDDMLQYSSPIEPCMLDDHGQRQQQRQQQADEAHNHRAATYTMDRVDTTLMREPEDQLQTMILSDPHSGSSQVVHRVEALELLAAHKSTSSGYDSISGSATEQHLSERLARQDSPSQVSSQAFVSNSNNNNSNHRTTSEAAQEDSSVRTESSLGCCSSSTTIETSPEQSAMKKLKAKMISNQTGIGQPNQGATTVVVAAAAAAATVPSAETADSLAAIAGDPFASTNAVAETTSRGGRAAGGPSSSDSPSSKARGKQVEQTQRKMPLMSRSRFFSRSSSKSRYWQLCMFVIGGKQGGSQAINEPLTIWRLYI